MLCRVLRHYLLKRNVNNNDNQPKKLTENVIEYNYPINFLTLSVPEKLKYSIFEMPIIPQTLNINNLGTGSTKSINLHTIRKFNEYSLKNVLVQAMFTVTVFEMLLSRGRSVLSPAQRSTESERVKICSINTIKWEKVEMSDDAFGFSYFPHKDNHW